MKGTPSDRFNMTAEAVSKRRNDTKFEDFFFFFFYYPRKHNLEASGSPLSGSHSLWECWSEDERIHTIAMVLKVRPPQTIDCQDIESLSKIMF